MSSGSKRSAAATSPRSAARMPRSARWSPSRRQGRARAARLRHDRRRLLALRRGQRPEAVDHGRAWRSRRRQGDAGRDRRCDPPHAFLHGEWPPETAEAIARGLSRALQARGQGGRRRRGALERHRRGPARRELRRPAGDLPQHPRRRRRCSTPAGAATPRSSPTAPSATARPRASTT